MKTRLGAVLAAGVLFAGEPARLGGAERGAPGIEQRVAQIMAPVETALAGLSPDRVRKACAKETRFELVLDHPSALPLPVLESWWGVAHVQMLCRGDLGLCRDRGVSAGGRGKEFEYYFKMSDCDHHAALHFVQGVLNGATRLDACRMAFFDYPKKIPEDILRADCAVYSDMVRSRDSTLCTKLIRKTERLDMRHETKNSNIPYGEGEACADLMAFIQPSAAACDDIRRDGALGDSIICLRLARSYAVFKTGNRRRCLDDPLCLAFSADPSVCDESTLEGARERVVERYCDHAASGRREELFLGLKAAADRASKELDDLVGRADRADPAAQSRNPESASERTSIGKARARLGDIRSLRNAPIREF